MLIHGAGLSIFCLSESLSGVVANNSLLESFATCVEFVNNDCLLKTKSPVYLGYFEAGMWFIL